MNLNKTRFSGLGDETRDVASFANPASDGIAERKNMSHVCSIGDVAFFIAEITKIRLNGCGVGQGKITVPPTKSEPLIKRQFGRWGRAGSGQNKN